MLDATFTTGASIFHATDIALLLSGESFVPSDTFSVSLEGGFPLADLTFDRGLGLSVSPPGPILGYVTLPISDLLTHLVAKHFNQFASIALQPNSLYWIDVNISDAASLNGADVAWRHLRCLGRRRRRELQQLGCDRLWLFSQSRRAAFRRRFRLPNGGERRGRA